MISPATIAPPYVPSVPSPNPAVSANSTESLKTRVFKAGAKIVTSPFREGDEKYLFLLTGDTVIRDTIVKFMPTICNALICLFPEYVKIIGGRKDPETLAQVAENLVLHVLANFGKRLFGPFPQEKVTKEAFFGKLSYFLLEKFWQHLHAVESGKEDTFEPLASELLAIALPEQEGYFLPFFTNSGKKLAKSFTRKPLANFLFLIYMRFFVRKPFSSEEMLEEEEIFEEVEEVFEEIEQSHEESKKEPIALNQEGFKEPIALAKQGLSFLLKSFASHLLAKEDLYFEKRVNQKDLSKIIGIILAPLIEHMTSSLEEMHKEYLPEDPVVLTDLATALIMLLIGGIARQNKEEELSLEQLFGDIVSRLFNNVNKAYSDVIAILAEKERKKTKYFDQFVLDTLSALAPEQKEFFKLILKRFPEVQSLISQIAMDFVLAFEVKGRQVDIQELRNLLWNKKEMEAKHPTVEDMPEIPDATESKRLGNEWLVENIHHACIEIGGNSLKSIEAFLSDSAVINQLIIEVYPELAVTKLEEVISGVCAALLSKQKSTNAFLFYIQDWIGAAIFRAVVGFLKNSSQGKKLELIKLVPAALENCVRIFDRHIPKEVGDEVPAPHQFIPLVNDLVAQLFEVDSLERSFEHLIPLPSWLQKKAAALLTQHALPMLCAKYYSEITVWQRKKQENQRALAILFENERANEVCRVLARFIPDLLAYYFRSSAKDLTALLLGHFKSYLIETTPKNSKKLNDLIVFAIRFIGVKYKSFAPLWNGIIAYGEGALLKVFEDFFEKIASMELLYLNDPARCFEGGLIIRITLHWLDDAIKHFQTVNQIKDKIGEKRASRVPQDVMLKGFKSSDMILKTSDEEFFESLTKRFLKLLNYREDSELPLPQIGKSIIWNLCKSQLFPIAVNAIFQKLTALPTIQQIVLSALKRINESLDPETAPSTSSSDVPDDHLQRELAQKCGDFVGAIIGLQPSIIPQEFLKHRDNIRNIIGFAIAEGLRNVIDRRSPLELFDELFENTITVIHPGKWVSRKGAGKRSVKDRFIPQKIGKDGKIKNGFSFSFPKTKAEEREFTVKNQKEEQKIAKELVKELTGMMSKQVDLTVQAGLIGMWNTFQTHFDKEIEKNFHSFGLRVKSYLDLICRTIFTIIIYPVLRIILFPLIKIVKLFIDTYLRNQAKWRAGDLGININKNFVLKFIDSIFNLLEERNKILNDS